MAVEVAQGSMVVQVVQGRRIGLHDLDPGDSLGHYGPGHIANNFLRGAMGLWTGANSEMGSWAGMDCGAGSRVSLGTRAGTGLSLGMREGTRLNSGVREEI